MDVFLRSSSQTVEQYERLLNHIIINIMSKQIVDTHHRRGAKPTVSQFIARLVCIEQIEPFIATKTVKQNSVILTIIIIIIIIIIIYQKVCVV